MIDFAKIQSISVLKVVFIQFKTTDIDSVLFAYVCMKEQASKSALVFVLSTPSATVLVT